MAAKESEVALRESAIKQRQAELEKTKESIDQEVARKLSEERSRIATEEARKAKQFLAAEIDQKSKELADLQEVLKIRDEKLAEAQKSQVELIRKQRELDDAKRELELTIEKRIEESLIEVRSRAKLEAEEGLKLRVAEKEQTIVSMQRKIEELMKKAEQGSQQLQGEVQELELEETLRSKFPFDIIEPVPKGEFGGDALHKVCSPSQQNCGTILWESKRTKNWSDNWLTKLREDQRCAKAEFSVLVTQVLPKGVDTFDLVEGVWVTSPRFIVPVAIALRHTLVELAMVRQSNHGQQSKMELIYQYLTGPRFRHRIEAIVEAFSSMQEDLNKEKKAIMKQWAKRESQIESVMSATVGMFGDLQGIAGKSIPEIEGLQLGALPSPSTNEETES